jgi:hypothetical protein
MRFLFLLSYIFSTVPVCQSQIKPTNNLNFETSEWFSVWTECNIYYQVSKNQIYIRINNGFIEKNPIEKHRNYQPWISTIHVSLTERYYEERRERHTWKTPYGSEKIDITQPVPPPGQKIDLSCLPEIQCFEFRINIPDNLDLTNYWLSITLTNPKGHTWHAHNNYYKSSFLVNSN